MDGTQKVDEKDLVICLDIMFTSRKWLIFCIEC